MQQSDIRESQPDTKERILDAAERLFAGGGFHCTSLRSITQEAQVNLAAVNYHFGGKEALMEAVMVRRLGPLNALRRQRLEAVLHAAREQGARPQVRAVLAAFIEPTFRFRYANPGGQAFVTLIGRSLAEPDDAVRNIFLRHMLPLFNLFFQALAAALPELPPARLFWRLQFILGGMSHVMCAGDRLRQLPSGQWPPGVQEISVDQLIEEILDFMSAGVREGQG